MNQGVSIFRGLGGLGAVLLVAFLGLPLVGLAFGIDLANVRLAFADEQFVPALLLSLGTSFVSLFVLVCVGIPLAWYVAERSNPWTRAVEMVLQLPAVTPPAVAGIALLSAFGRSGLLGGVLNALDLTIGFSTFAVVFAQIFVASPFFLLPAIDAFRGIDRELLLVARSLGASSPRVFMRVALPLSRRSLFVAAVMAWARALGEFGATLMFAGNLPGVTQTLPLAIYTALERDVDIARVMAMALLLVALLAFVLSRWLRREQYR